MRTKPNNTSPSFGNIPLPSETRNALRAIACLAQHPDDPQEAIRSAEREHGRLVANIVKAVVNPATTFGSDSEAIAATESVAALSFSAWERSIPGQMSELVRVQPNVRALYGTAKAGSFSKEGQPIKVNAGSFSASNLEPLKCAAVSVYTKEQTQFSDPGFQNLLRTDLSHGISEAIDEAFLDPANSGVANQKPASVTSSLTPIAASADPLADLKSLTADFAGDLTSSYFIASPTTFTSMAGRDLPNIGANGGELLGVPALASRKSPAGVVILADASGIAVAEGDVEISATNEATIEMDDDPSQPTANMVSLWQSDLIALGVTKHMNWAKSRPDAVSYISGADYA